MTRLLELALAKVSRLPEEAQDHIARIIMDELEADAAWQTRFREGQSKLATLAEAARQEIASARVLECDPADDLQK